MQRLVPGDAPVLRVEGLGGSFAGRRIVEGVDLVVRDGEIVTLVGPSGCGKSTLTRLIAGLVRPDSGRVFVGDADVTVVAPERRRIGLVFQDAALFGHLRVAENVAFGLRDLPRQERHNRVNEMLEMVGLGNCARRRPHELSGGEQQRVALARALAPRPRVLLLDEPFANLDEVLRDSLRRQVAEILRMAGTASVLVTHDRSEAMSIGDRVAVMSEGRIEQCDNPRAVYETPVNRFVTAFLDEANFVPAGDGSMAVVRPHDVIVARGGEDRVTRVDFFGSRCRYEIGRSDGMMLIAESSGHDTLVVGDACTAEFDLTRRHRIVD